MLEISDAKTLVLGIVQHDPLFIVLKHTPLVETLYGDNYLTHIDETQHYSISEVAGWFDITDAMLRYYIKPFEQYIFDSATNLIPTIRLDLPAILRLRMILLLKDEYRVKGLKLLLGIDDNAQQIKHQITATTLDSTDNLTNKVDVLGSVLQQMIQTGLFHMEPNESQGTLHISINHDFLAQQMLSSESSRQIEIIQNETTELKHINENLQKQMQELQEGSVKDIVKKIRERHIENEIVSTLRTEALQLFALEKKAGFFAKIFRASQIEMEKEQFVFGYISQHLEERLEAALNTYYGA
ncbi:hypothetical protein ACIQXI_09565 [Lysinibacillus sp. NPDC097195]|uniref:hypothetical protein n=1 Tax=Lysinibacillus sp. NPDC097195 TaxID=3364141 RepID=UPI0037F61FAF